MRTRLVTFLILIMALPATAERSGCRNLSVRVEFHNKQLAEFDQLAVDLEKKYQRYVAADFDAQADGLLGTLSRNKAIKVIYARKRLKKAVAETRLAQSSATKEYCGVCLSDLDRPTTKGVYCGLCPEEPGCLGIQLKIKKN